MTGSTISIYMKCNESDDATGVDDARDETVVKKGWKECDEGCTV